MPTAYSYVRFSTRAQADGDSLRRQTEKARTYARKHNLTLDDRLTFQDLGVSGYDRSNVTTGQLGAFMEAVEAGKVERGSFLLVEQFDRLSRAKPIVAFRQLEGLISAGIQVVTLDDEKVYNNDSVDDISMLFLSMATMFRAHNESLSKSKRIGEAWKAKVARRESVLTRECPRWLIARADRSGFDIIEDRAESVRRVFELTLKGYGNVAIARRANAENWPHPGKAVSWSQSLITKIVRNRAVIGEHHPHQKKDGKRVPIDEPWPNYYPRVISDEDFALANAIKSQREKVPARRDKHYKNLFQGILTCGACGASMVRKNKASTKQQGYFIYMCAQRVSGATKCTSVAGPLLEKALLTNIYVEAYPQIRTDEEAQRLKGRQAVLTLDLSTKKAEAERLVNAIATTDSPLLIERLTGTEKALNQLSMELQQVQRKIGQLQLTNQTIGSMMTSVFLDDYLRVQDENEIEFRAELREKILSVVRRIVVYPEKQTAIFFYKHVAEPNSQPLDWEEYINFDELPELMSHAARFLKETD